MTHTLKTWPEYFEAVIKGDKTFEVRRFDRPFKVGDKLILQEWDNEKEQYTGREHAVIITYILQGDVKFGLSPDFCVMGILLVDSNRRVKG